MSVDLRITISDAADTLFPRNVLEAPSLSSKYLPLKPTSARTLPSAEAQRAHSHDDWFRHDRRSMLSRGNETRRRVADLLRAQGVLREPENLCDLAVELLEAMRQARSEKRTIWISPGLIKAPSCTNAFRKNGWRTPVGFANFKPAFLKIKYLGPAKPHYWSLTVVGIKSTHPGAVPGKVYQDEEFSLLAYRYFLSNLLTQFKNCAKKDGHHLLARLDITNTSELYRYSGCYAHYCAAEACVLNRNIAPQTLPVIPVKDDPAFIKQVLFERIPRELGIRRRHGPPPAAQQVYTIGYCQLVSDLDRFGL